MNTPRHRRRDAFSLVELLVVIGIIGIGIALLLPALSGVRACSRRTSCASNLRQVGLLFYAYANDNHGELPAVYGGVKGDPHPRPTAFTRPVADEHGGIKLLVAPPIGLAQQPYTDSGKIFLCPGEDQLQPFGGNENEFGYNPGWGTLPAGSQHRGISYLYCYVPDGGDWFQQWWIVNGAQQHWEPGAFAGFERHNLRQPRSAATAVMIERTLVHTLGAAPDPGFHGANGNVLYLDGHVANLRHADVPGKVRGDSSHAGTKAILKAVDEKAGGS